MDKRNAELILNDPHSTADERAAAQAALDEGAAEAELLQYTGKPRLEDIEWLDVHRFCRERGWTKTRDLYDRWLCAYFKTEHGKKDLARMADYMRRCDFDEWKYAADLWKASGYKDAARLIEVLGRIADSPSRGNYHHPETVEGARMFLAEIKRRCA